MRYPVDAKVTKFSSGKMLGFAAVMFAFNEGEDAVIQLDGFKLFRATDGGIQVALPSTLDKKGEYKNIFYPLQKESESFQNWMESISNLVSQKYAALDSAPAPTPQQQTTSAIHTNDDIPF